jgi:hypothetical protein
MEVFVSAMTLSSLTVVTSFGSPAAIDAFAVASSASAFRLRHGQRLCGRGY